MKQPVWAFASLSCQGAYAILLIAVLALGACGTRTATPVEPEMPQEGLSIIGAAKIIGLKGSVETSRVANELAYQISAQRGLKVTPASTVRRMLGAAPHDQMMQHYARQGKFAPDQLQRLMAANLPSSTAMVVRLESDDIVRLPLRRQKVATAEGLILENREIHTYVTRRTTGLSARLIDLRTGRDLWSRALLATREVAQRSDHRIGESFGESVAAEVANTLIKGIGEPQHPPPPALADNVIQLISELVQSAPLR